MARAERAEECAREGLWSKAAAAPLDVGVAAASEDVREQLGRLHPDPNLTVHNFSHVGAQAPPAVTASCVLDQLRSFPKGTAAGPSGLRAQHFLDALSNQRPQSL